MEEIILFNNRVQLMEQVKERSIVTIAIGPKKYCLTRVGEDVFVFESKCPHFDHPMNDAKVSPLGKVTCTWHNYQFDLNHGKETENRCHSLKTRKAYWNPSGQLAVQL